MTAPAASFERTSCLQPESIEHTLQVERRLRTHAAGARESLEAIESHIIFGSNKRMTIH